MVLAVSTNRSAYALLADGGGSATWTGFLGRHAFFPAILFLRLGRPNRIARPAVSPGPSRNRFHRTGGFAPATRRLLTTTLNGQCRPRLYRPQADLGIRWPLKRGGCLRNSSQREKSPVLEHGGDGDHGRRLDLFFRAAHAVDRSRDLG